MAAFKIADNVLYAFFGRTILFSERRRLQSVWKYKRLHRFWCFSLWSDFGQTPRAIGNSRKVSANTFHQVHCFSTVFYLKLRYRVDQCESRSFTYGDLLLCPDDSSFIWELYGPRQSSGLKLEAGCSFLRVPLKWSILRVFPLRLLPTDLVTLKINVAKWQSLKENV